MKIALLGLELFDWTGEDSLPIMKIASENKHKNKCSTCTLYTVLFSIIVTVNIGISTYFVTAKTRIVIKKMFLNMIMSIKQEIINIDGKY